MPAVSVFGSWARPKDWPQSFIYLSTNAVDYEIVIAGPNKPSFALPSNVTFIHTTPDPGECRCAQIAADHCKGETMILSGDDIRYSPHTLDNLYRKYKEENDYKCLVHPRWGTPDNDKTDKDAFLFEIPGSTLRYGFVLWSRQFFRELG